MLVGHPLAVIVTGLRRQPPKNTRRNYRPPHANQPRNTPQRCVLALPSTPPHEGHRLVLELRPRRLRGACPELACPAVTSSGRASSWLVAASPPNAIPPRTNEGSTRTSGSGDSRVPVAASRLRAATPMAVRRRAPRTRPMQSRGGVGPGRPGADAQGYGNDGSAHGQGPDGQVVGVEPPLLESLVGSCGLRAESRRPSRPRRNGDRQTARPRAGGPAPRSRPRRRPRSPIGLHSRAARSGQGRGCADRRRGRRGPSVGTAR